MLYRLFKNLSILNKNNEEGKPSVIILQDKLKYFS